MNKLYGHLNYKIGVTCILNRQELYKTPVTPNSVATATSRRC